MKKHTKIFFQSRNITPGDYVECEIPGCPSECVDVNHIKARGMGGSKHRDTPDNLIGLCRACHDMYGDSKGHREWLRKIVRNILNIEEE